MSNNLWIIMWIGTTFCPPEPPRPMPDRSLLGWLLARRRKRLQEAACGPAGSSQPGNHDGAGKSLQ